MHGFCWTTCSYSVIFNLISSSLTVIDSLATWFPFCIMHERGRVIHSPVALGEADTLKSLQLVYFVECDITIFCFGQSRVTYRVCILELASHSVRF